MTVASWVAMYFILWWLCLFVVLPFGAHSQSDAGDVVEGTEPGAPALFRLWPRLLATSVVAGIVLVLVMWALANPMLIHYWS